MSGQDRGRERRLERIVDRAENLADKAMDDPEMELKDIQRLRDAVLKLQEGHRKVVESPASLSTAEKFLPFDIDDKLDEMESELERLEGR